MKICTKCGENKELSEFYKKTPTKDKLYHQCKNCCNKHSKKYHNENRAKILIRQKQHYENNKPKRLKSQKQYYQNNLNDRNTYDKKYRKKNRKKINKYIKTKTNIDPTFKLRHNISTLILLSFKNKGYSKNTKTAQILGCNFKIFQNHLMSSFINNYNRLPNNNDKLNIDHIIPLAIAKTEEDVIKLNHYSNLQWLLRKDNLEKSDKLDWNLHD